VSAGGEAIGGRVLIAQEVLRSIDQAARFESRCGSPAWAEFLRREAGLLSQAYGLDHARTKPDLDALEAEINSLSA